LFSVVGEKGAAGDCLFPESSLIIGSSYRKSPRLWAHTGRVCSSSSCGCLVAAQICLCSFFYLFGLFWHLSYSLAMAMEKKKDFFLVLHQTEVFPLVLWFMAFPCFLVLLPISLARRVMDCFVVCWLRDKA